MVSILPSIWVSENAIFAIDLAAPGWPYRRPKDFGGLPGMTLPVITPRPCIARHSATPSVSKRGELVPFVAPLCGKVLRLVTVQLPEKSWPLGPVRCRPTRRRELRLIGVLRTSPFGDSANFAFTEFCEVRKESCKKYCN
jgi:hypothetical protein